VSECYLRVGSPTICASKRRWEHRVKCSTDTAHNLPRAFAPLSMDGRLINSHVCKDVVLSVTVLDYTPAHFQILPWPVIVSQRPIHPNKRTLHLLHLTQSTVYQKTRIQQPVARPASILPQLISRSSLSSGVKHRELIGQGRSAYNIREQQARRHWLVVHLQRLEAFHAGLSLSPMEGSTLCLHIR